MGGAMSFKIEQKVKGTIYVYEAVSYWDKEKKQSRQKKKLIGKRDPKTNKIIPTGKNPQKVKIKDYGCTDFLEKIYRKIGLLDEVKSVFKDTYSEIMTIISFMLTENKPVYLAADWLEANYSSFSNINISSQRLSELFKNIGKTPDKKFSFFRNWIHRNKPNDIVFYDITSISSYSEKLDIAEWGYNRDKEKLKQVNMGLIYGKNSNVPLSYNFNQGSISDVSTLKKTMEFNNELGLKEVLYIMDRGFYSQKNLDNISDEKLIIPVPYSTNLAKDIVEENKNELSSDDNMMYYNDHLYYYLSRKKTINNKDYKIHVFRDKVKYEIRETEFYKEILNIEKRLNTVPFGSKDDLEEELRTIAKSKFRFFQIKNNDNKFYIERKLEEIVKAKQRFGTVVYLTNSSKLFKEDVIRLQKNRDYIEKVFNSMKNELSQNRLRVNSSDRVDGKLFVIFLALIVNSYIEKIRKNSKTLKNKTKKEIFYELKKIKSVIYSNSFKQITELSKRAKDIYDSFEFKYPENNS